MKRFHVNVAVTDLDKSTEFYRTLFGVEPTVRLRALQDLAMRRNSSVLASATIAAPLMASISMSLRVTARGTRAL